MSDILFVGLDSDDLETIETAMQWIVDTQTHWSRADERRKAQDVIVTIDAAKSGDWTP